MTHAFPAQAAPRPDGAVPLFALRDVSLERGGTRVLEHLTLELPRGAITGLVGPSGSGKTSLLRLLNRLEEPSCGSIELLGRPLTDYAVRTLRRRVGFVFQLTAPFPGSVADNLMIAWELGASVGPAPDPEAILASVGLGPECMARPASELSGGELQRVGLARALMTNPEVLLLDEPTSALDPEAAQRLLGTVTTLARERGVAVILVTHRLGEARQATAHIVMLEQGRVVEAGATATLFGAATTERARAYLASGA